MTTLEIVLLFIVAVMLAIPPIGNLVAAMLRRAGKERAALWVEGAIPIAVRVMRLASTIGGAVAAKSSAAQLLESESDRPTDPPAPPTLPLIGGTLVLCFMLVGCSGAKEGIEHGLEAARDVQAYAQPCLAAERDADFDACGGDADCTERVREKWRPVESAFASFHAFWCSVSPSAEGCS